LVAALNWGHRFGYFETDRPWRAVAPFPVSDGQRDGYLSDIQRTALIAACAKNKMGEARPRVFYLYEPAAFAFFERMAADKPPGAYLMTKSDGSGWMYDTT
jgi:hypothetical protein